MRRAGPFFLTKNQSLLADQKQSISSKSKDVLQGTRRIRKKSMAKIFLNTHSFANDFPVAWQTRKSPLRSVRAKRANP